MCACLRGGMLSHSGCSGASISRWAGSRLLQRARHARVVARRPAGGGGRVLRVHRRDDAAAATAAEQQERSGAGEAASWFSARRAGCCWPRASRRSRGSGRDSGSVWSASGGRSLSRSLAAACAAGLHRCRRLVPVIGSGCQIISAASAMTAKAPAGISQRLTPDASACWPTSSAVRRAARSRPAVSGSMCRAASLVQSAGALLKFAVEPALGPVVQAYVIAIPPIDRADDAWRVTDVS